MYNSKLVQVFFSLDGVSKRALHKFIRSPFFNQRQEVIALWDYLVQSKNGTKKALKKEEIFSFLFPGEKFDDTKIRLIMSWLLNCIEEYLAYRQYKQQKVFSQIYLVKAYRHLNLEKHFNQEVKRSRNLLDKMEIGQDYLHAQYLLEMEHYAFAESRRRTTGNNLQVLSKILDIRIVSGKLRQSCLLFAHQAVFKTDYDYTFLPALLDYLENSVYLENPAIGMYYYCYRALTENNPDFFQKFKFELQRSQARFSLAELRDCFLMAINYCIKQINQGNEEYRIEAFELFKSALAINVLLIDGYLSRFTYTNIVAAGLKVKEYDWVDSFLKDYRPLLEPRYRSNYYHYCRARYYVDLKDYEKAMHLLVAVDEEDLLVSLDARNMLIKIYFELKEHSALESLLNSMQTFISRKKVMGYHRKHYLGTIQFTRKLLYLTKTDKAGQEKLREEIIKAEILPDRNWLLQQLEDMSK